MNRKRERWMKIEQEKRRKTENDIMMNNWGLNDLMSLVFRGSHDEHEREATNPHRGQQKKQKKPHTYTHTHTHKDKDEEVKTEEIKKGKWIINTKKTK